MCQVEECKNNFVNDTYDKTVTKTAVKVSRTLGNRMVESPTLMDRWRITVLGKLVLYLPIKETLEYPSYWSKSVYNNRETEWNWISGYVQRVPTWFLFCARGLATKEQKVPKTKWIQVLFHLNSASIWVRLKNRKFQVLQIC